MACLNDEYYLLLLSSHYLTHRFSCQEKLLMVPSPDCYMQKLSNWHTQYQAAGVNQLAPNGSFVRHVMVIYALCFIYGSAHVHLPNMGMVYIPNN